MDTCFGCSVGAPDQRSHFDGCLGNPPSPIGTQAFVPFKPPSLDDVYHLLDFQRNLKWEKTSIKISVQGCESQCVFTINTDTVSDTYCPISNYHKTVIFEELKKRRLNFYKDVKLEAVLLAEDVIEASIRFYNSEFFTLFYVSK